MYSVSDSLPVWSHHFYCGLRWSSIFVTFTLKKIMQMIKKLFENAHGHVIIVIVFIEKRITMKNIFQNSSSNWVRYDKYEWHTSADGKCYITPAADAKPSIYNPIEDY